MNIVPYDEAFEKALIVGLLSDTSLIPKVGTILSPEDMFQPAHKEILSVIFDLDVNTVDSLTVQNKLSDSTKEYFQTLVNNSDALLPTLTNILVYAETIRDKSRLRAGIDLGREIAALCYQPNIPAPEALQQVEEMFGAFLRSRLSFNADNITTKQMFLDFLSNLGNKLEDPNAIKTGFEELDIILQKLEGLVIVAGLTSSGKTAFSLNVALNVIKAGHTVVFFSLEQSEEQIFERLLSIESEVPLEEIRLGIHEEFSGADDRLKEFMELLHLDDRPAIKTSYIASVTRQKGLDWGQVGLIVVDYLQLLSLSDREQAVSLGEACKELRALGKEMGCPVILLSQFNRGGDSRETRRPSLKDLRGSGEIEQVADEVLFVHRESYFNTPGTLIEFDEAEIIIAKSRNGRPGIITLDWMPKCVKFKSRKDFNQW